MKPTTVCILMATFNGARYVEEQIASIQQQTLQKWTLLVRDDGSTDNTIEKVKLLAEQDQRIQGTDTDNRYNSHAPLQNALSSSRQLHSTKRWRNTSFSLYFRVPGRREG